MERSRVIVAFGALLLFVAAAPADDDPGRCPSHAGCAAVQLLLLPDAAQFALQSRHAPPLLRKVHRQMASAQQPLSHCVQQLNCESDPSGSQRVCRYLARLLSHRRHLRTQPLRALVVGSGPAGLLAGLLLWKAGGDVTLIEKRRASDTYLRDTWFDLYTSDSAASYETMLGQWGGEELGMEVERHAGNQVVSVRCRLLQGLLLKSLTLLSGHTVAYGQSLLRVQRGRPRARARGWAVVRRAKQRARRMRVDLVRLVCVPCV